MSWKTCLPIIFKEVFKQLADLAGHGCEGEGAAVANLDAVEEAAGLGQQLQHVGQRQVSNVPQRIYDGKKTHLKAKNQYFC